MNHLETLLMNEVLKPLEQMERNNIGYINRESVDTIYYKIDDREFAIKVKEIDENRKELNTESECD